MPDHLVQGRCLCGTVRFEIDKAIDTVVNCHCESCRRQCSSPMTTFVGVGDGKWRWLSGPPKVYNSSPGVERRFCPECGSPISFRSKNMSGMMHFYVASLDNPENFQPTLHCSYEEKLSWLELNDQLPKTVGPDYTKADIQNR